MVGHRVWTDGKRHQVQQVLGAVVVGGEGAAREIAENHRRIEQSAKERDRAMCLRRKDETLIKDLDAMASKWAEATKVRSFLRAVEEQVPAEREQEGFAAWLAWARARADGLDPLSFPEEIAKVVDPELLGCDEG